MPMPYRSLADPETQGEGSIDPMGLANLADQLADWLLPWMTARMWRPRFLTAIAASWLLIEPFEEEVAKDGLTPPWIVLEWYYVEGVAALAEDNGGNLRRVPGIDKARRALREEVPLSARRYLKTPKVFGFHGVYKRLARALDIVDDSLRGGDVGYALLKIWQEEQDLPGFLDGNHGAGDGARILRTIRDALREALDAGQTRRQGAWVGASFFVNHLLPHKIGYRESDFLWQRLTASEPQGEVFTLMRDRAVRSALDEPLGERGALQSLLSRASAELRRRLEAIEAYEGFCRPLQEAWDILRYRSTLSRPAVVRPEDFTGHPRVAQLVAEIARSIEEGRRLLAESPVDAGFDSLVGAFERAGKAQDLYLALWDHHQTIQKGKPPEGKRPWFEETNEGGLIVRPPYRIDQEVPAQEAFVHPYRLWSVASFIEDLGRGS